MCVFQRICDGQVSFENKYYPKKPWSENDIPDFDANKTGRQPFRISSP